MINQESLERLVSEHKAITATGTVASYIPKLKEKNPSDLGIYVFTEDGTEYGAGDFDVKFTIQSISKIFVFALAIMDNGEREVFKLIGVEPTGDSFNSIANLELKDTHKPYNPMINAGAILATSMIHGNTKKEKFNRILDLIRACCDNSTLEINESVYHSEKDTGDRNRALAYFIKSYGLIEDEIDNVLDTYFKQCSIEVTCRDIAHAAWIISNNGVNIRTGQRVLSQRICSILKTVMFTCGLYDASGSFALDVGMPSKSGVGGGILSTTNMGIGIGVYGPALDQKGNSVAGASMLKAISRDNGLSIF